MLLRHSSHTITLYPSCGIHRVRVLGAVISLLTKPNLLSFKESELIGDACFVVCPVRVLGVTASNRSCAFLDNWNHRCAAARSTRTAQRGKAHFPF